jgi:acyl dehydratase
MDPSDSENPAEGDVAGAGEEAFETGMRAAERNDADTDNAARAGAPAAAAAAGAPTDAAAAGTPETEAAEGDAAGAAVASEHAILRRDAAADVLTAAQRRHTPLKVVAEALHLDQHVLLLDLCGAVGLAREQREVDVDAGERLLELHRPLGCFESLMMMSKETAICRGGSGAIVQSETLMHDRKSGELVGKITSNTFYVGSGDLVVPKGKIVKFVVPVPTDRQPDVVIERATSQMQAALYRLSGDYNPLHIDPEIASVFEYKEPILYGLCTLGFACNIVVQSCLDGDESRVRRIGCRFAKPTYPGQLLRVEMWRIGGGKVSFRVRDANGVTVIDQAFVDTQSPTVIGKL